MDTTLVIFQIAILIFSAVIHEFFHGWTANYLGDPTAKQLGRLTLNPIAHLDLIGSFLLPVFLIISGSPIVLGWAKPVPYNPYNLSDQKYGSTKVALAGPLSNFILALIFGLSLRFFDLTGFTATAFQIIVLINLILGVFNLIPVPPLDGSKLVMDLFPRAAAIYSQLSFFGIFIALLVAYYWIFDLVTILFTYITGIPI